MALQLVLHTFRMIFGNIGQALRVSIGPFLLLISIGMVIGFGALTSIEGGPNPPSMAFALLPILFLPMILFITAWVAVSWHRFILLEEYTVILPAVKDRPIWSYVGKAILLGLLMLVIAFPVLLVLGPVTMSHFSDPVVVEQALSGQQVQLPVTLLLLNAIAAVIFSFFSLRWGIALVATALGNQMGFFEGWSATKPIAGTIFGVSVILMVINFGPTLILNPLTLALPIVGTVINIILQWITMMLGISILTTIYGHVVENRPLID